MTQTVGVRPQEIDLDVLAGEPIDFTVPVLDDDDVAQDASTYTARAQIRPHAGGRLLASPTLTPGAAGIRVQVDPTDTATWAQWRSPLARWDLWITPPAEESRPLARGRVFVRSPISTEA